VLARGPDLLRAWAWRSADQRERRAFSEKNERRHRAQRSHPARPAGNDLDGCRRRAKVRLGSDADRRAAAAGDACLRIGLAVTA
jgi:hypothetical protein